MRRLGFCMLVLICIMPIGQATRAERNWKFRASGLRIQQQSVCPDKRVSSTRPHSVSITEFGAVGDGVTLNTHAFDNAIFYLRSFADKGGAQLFVPAGRWLTGSFNLTSHLTLNLDKDAVILGSQDSKHWPVLDPLPSYGRGRELSGGRHSSLITAFNVTDIIITGENGTIDGQGSIWWDSFHKHTLSYTRPHLVEVVDSTDVVISNLTFLNSPFWNIHPVYCSNVHIESVTILAPSHSPNTDGIDPDSSSYICIKNCYISTGDDMISIKSGWDEYGIAYGRPSSNIIIRNVTGETPTSAGLALGSEMSGGIRDVQVENLNVYNSRYGIRLKTAPGRGGYVKDIFISKVTLMDVQIALAFTGDFGDHPDDGYDPSAFPDVDRISFTDIVGDNITIAGGAVSEFEDSLCGVGGSCSYFPFWQAQIICWLTSMKTRSSVINPPIGVTVTTPHFKREEAFRRSTFIVNIFHCRQSRPPKPEIAAMLRPRLCLPDSCVIYLSKFRTAGPHSRGFGLVYDSMGDTQKYEPSYKLKKMVVPFDIPNSAKDLKNCAKKNPHGYKKKIASK